MDDAMSLDDPMTLTADDDLETVLEAWHAATVRLERTHEALRAEVARLTDELEAKSRELARKNRLADLGRMAAHVAHEVRNSLVPVTLYLGVLRRRLERDPEGLDALGKISAGFTALDATVNDLLHFTSDRDPQRRPFSVRKLVDGLLGSLAPQLAAQSIRAVAEIVGDAPADADPDMLRRAALNLLLNAIDAMPEGGELAVRASVGDDGLAVEVADTGPGLADEALGRALEPFFTTKAGGTGLGLAIVSRIAEAHGGEVRAANRPRGGAAFTLIIPKRKLEAAA